jgi:eukaryotic-like serine/threonine-protein kinase
MPNGPSPRDPGPAPLSPGASIGRYLVLGLVGRGGMGEVYAAYDPELDRKVAVKLLRVKPGNGVSLNEGRQRTLREAQAIARLSHPNVVVVFDVGTFDDKVFIAMEFLDGNTVAYWLQSQPRPWQEVLEVFMAAGRGLMAAHDKGLVHRDFKPDNVMIGRDGQVRVMDFGLARQVSAKSRLAESPAQRRQLPIQLPGGAVDLEIGDNQTIVLGARQNEAETVTSNPGLFEARLTRTGAMMGTPAYMAPEQFFGSPTDARTDQFSFCVSLYEALYGERPFAGNNLTALTANVVQGSAREPPAGTKVPLWIRKILLRGLRPTIGDRYPTMGDLLDALANSPYARHRRLVVAGATLLLILGFGLGVRQSLADHGEVCGGGAEKLADVWELAQPGQPSSQREPPRRAAVRAAFLRSGKSYAADVLKTASRALTAYAQSWANMYRETCEATQVRHEQSAEVLDLRMSCLQERLGGLRALTNVFSDATGEVVENAVGATNALASLDRCTDVMLLRAVIRPPEDPATRAKVSELRHRLADLKARLDAGRWKEALKDGPALVVAARSLGYQPLLAESLALLGAVFVKAVDAEPAERTLIEAFSTADASRHDEVRAEVAGNLVYVVGYMEAHFAEGHHWEQAANAVLDRLGGHDLLRSWLLNDVGCVLELEGRRVEAVRAQEQALVLKEKVLGPDHPDLGTSETNLAIDLQELGRNTEALAHNDRAITLQRNGLGADHPDLAFSFSEGGEILNALGRYREARLSFERALASWGRQLEPDSRLLGYPLTGIGVSYLSEGKAAEAVEPLERALKIRETQEPELPKRAQTEFALARALWESNRGHGRARALAAAAKQDYAKSSAREEELEVETWLAGHVDPASHQRS